MQYIRERNPRTLYTLSPILYATIALLLNMVQYNSAWYTYTLMQIEEIKVKYCLIVLE